jgi:hypothetical protein
MSKDLDSLFAGLIREAEDFKRKGGRIAKKSGLPTTQPIASRSGKAQGAPARDAMAAIDAAIAKRKADLDQLRKRETPAGWKKDCLSATIVSCECETCGTVSETLSPPVVYLVQSAIRNPATRHLIPISRSELDHFQSLGLSLIVERTHGTSPICPVCASRSLSPSSQTPHVSPPADVPTSSLAPTHHLIPIGPLNLAGQIAGYLTGSIQETPHA